MADKISGIGQYVPFGDTEKGPDQIGSYRVPFGPGPVAMAESELAGALDTLCDWLFNLDLECSGVSLCAIESIAVGGAVLRLDGLRDALAIALDRFPTSA